MTHAIGRAAAAPSRTVGAAPGRAVAGLVLAAVCVAAAPARAQTLLDRTPNVAGGWVGPAGTLHFNFLHRFNQSGAPQRQVTNRPTFLLAAGIGGRALAGVHYATRSDVVARMPNEWEVFGRYAVLQPQRRIGLAVQAGYNASAQSGDAEVSASGRFGRLRLTGAGRLLGSAYGGDARGAVAVGATIRLTRAFALAADAGTLLDRETGEDAAWGVGLHGVIPTTPHSFSLQATNTNSATLQGASRGAGEVRWGFEFTVPLTLRRYFGARAVSASADAEPETGDVFRAGMRELAYTPAQITISAGTTVVWRNDDVVEHTVTAVDGSWDSGLIAPGATWRRTFTAAGTFDFICTPHPFMRGVVIVRDRP